MLETKLRGARTHNLAGVDLDLEPGQVVVLTGVSGAGKSSLAMDTLYAEGQRRFVESFSPYARQFLERLERPPIDSLEPVPAGIAVDRRAPVKSSRSTVATMADLEPYLAAPFVRRDSRDTRSRCAAQRVHRQRIRGDPPIQERRVVPLPEVLQADLDVLFLPCEARLRRERAPRSAVFPGAIRSSESQRPEARFSLGDENP